MMYLFAALSIIVAIMTICVSWLLDDNGLIPVIGLALSSFTFGFIMGENRND
jgi:hypothetical protein